MRWSMQCAWIGGVAKALLLTVMCGACLVAWADEAPILQPGAPGEAPRQLSAQEAIQLANTRYSPDDVRFMQDMIPHHYQAVEMAALVAGRTNRPEIVDLAGRIDASQADEIAFMQDWLRQRGEHAPDPSAEHAMHMSQHMAGMATPEQMAALAEAEGTAFDRHFLELMIPHHQGAITMVEQLKERPGSAFDPILFEFIGDVVNDQSAEIERMNALLASLSDDPRAGLAAGLKDAGQAIHNLRLLATVPRPTGFFDPENPSDLPPAPPPKDAEDAEDVAGDDASDETGADADAETSSSDRDLRWSFLSFSNTDMAFSGDMLVAGSYHGFNIYRLDADGIPKLVSSVVCPGGQGDVSIVGDLLITSVEETRARIDCGLQGVTEDVSAERFRGLRIFDISDPRRPVQVGGVQTCRGSHTHSVVSGPEETGSIIVYNSGTASIREAEELAGCVEGLPGEYETALFRIDVIEIPVDDPASARIVDSPAVFADPDQGRLAGLWRGGDHGARTQETNRTDHCHDITVFPEAKIAAGACSGNGIVFDISDPRKPKRIDEVVDPGFAYWHSATFNNTGTTVIFTDEWGGGVRPRCRAGDPRTWGANAIYDLINGRLAFRGYYKIPAPQSETENCVAHNGSIIPVPGRDIFAQAWYQGGLSIVDFTDPANPVEIGFFDRGPVDAKRLSLAGYWSTYWYNGRIYGTEIVRGVDVFALTPSEYLTDNEIRAAERAEMGTVFNPQRQVRVTWPAEPVVAHAYLDQLERDGGLAATTIATVRTVLDEFATHRAGGAETPGLARRLREQALALAAPGADARATATARREALSATLQGLAEQVL